MNTKPTREVASRRLPHYVIHPEHASNRALYFRRPLETLSAQRPETRVFSPYMMLSILGQFLMNLWALISAVRLVDEHDPSRRLEPVDLEVWHVYVAVLFKSWCQSFSAPNLRHSNYRTFLIPNVARS